MNLACRHVSALLLGALLLAACKPGETPEAPEKARAYVHALHLYPGSEQISLVMASLGTRRTIADAISYGQSWPGSGYASVLTYVQDSSASAAWQTVLEVLDRQSRDTIVPVVPLPVLPGLYTSIVLIDSFGKPMLVRTVDDFGDTPAGQGLVRLMNLSTEPRSVSLEVKQDSLAISRLSFLNYSRFYTLKPGVYTFYFINDLNRTRLDSIPNVQIRANQAYNFYLARRNGQIRGAYETLK
jgi:hypothetical protein